MSEKKKPFVMTKEQEERFNKAMEKVGRSKMEGSIPYPIEVTAAKITGLKYNQKSLGSRVTVGDPVSIRPVKSVDPEEKTYLGFYMGDIPCMGTIFYDPEDKDLKFMVRGNPGIFVPALKRMVFGFESWWGAIKDEKHLREITNEDIQNVWYVQALKWITEKKESEDKEGTS